ncbi:MAG: hypothetical protein ACTHLA_02490 [Asticcacaulis sp.]|uniref:hypothetical protein n=1 Tax=Asticcacaulis sp. TaxID=1872648 RepID=UPI003F7BFD76
MSIAVAWRDPEYLAYLWIPFPAVVAAGDEVGFFDPQISQMFMVVARYRYRREMRSSALPLRGV